MKGLIDFFKPAPHIVEIQDPQELDKTYKYWRYRTLYSMFFGYALYYFTRKSFTFAMPGMIADLNFDKSHLGILGSVLSITYGISKFASSIISDKSNPRYFMAFGLFLTGGFNICFGMSSSILMFALFWGLNGWFQGFGWPPCARFLTHWYSQSERGAWWSTWNISHNVGAFTIPWIVGACLYYWDWRVAMYVPGIICILGSVVLINRLRDTPQSLGLPPVEVYRNDYVGSNLIPGEKERELTTNEILFEYVLKNKYIWLLAVAYFFVYVVRTGINDWTALFLIEAKGYSQIGASGCVSIFEVGGLVGSLFAGWASDRLLGARRGPVNVAFAIGMFVTIGAFWYVPEGYPWIDSMAMFMIGFMIFGPQMLIGLVAAELSHKKAAATSSGFVGLFAYVGAACAGYPLGKIAQDWGWNGFFWAMVVCCAVSALLLIPMWNVKERKVPPSKLSAEEIAAEPEPA